MKLKYILNIGLSSLLLCSVVNAQDGDKPKKKAKRSFEALDTDKDGKLSLVEYNTGAKDEAKAKKRFTKKDKDSDGFLTKEEYMKRGKGKNAPKKPERGDA